MIGELWWSRLVNSVRFLDDAEDSLTDRKSVVLSFENDIPWQDIMTEILSQNLAKFNDTRTFEIHNVKDIKTPDKYLFETFCIEKERKKYWPTTHTSYERFLALNRDIPLNKRYVCLAGIDSDNSQVWINSIEEYVKNCNPDDEYGIFILLITKNSKINSDWLEVFRYEDYVSDYDCMMLCLTMISSLSCSRTKKMYLCETASAIAHNNVELAGLLVSEKLELIKNPLEVTERVYLENGIKSTKLKELVKMAVWEAQVKLVFPKLENFRSDFIRKYKTKLQKFLPIKSFGNDEISKASDLELGNILYICNRSKFGKIADYEEYDMLVKMHNARNSLAHLETLSYEDLKELEIF